jgi:Asp-tRNA(Asn)/Glu-tRNA(Gln) amidotransferase A subunit family amidase
VLEAAGYADVGKTNLHEFAYGTTSENPHFGTVPNPLSPDRVAGGSSGGNAAALVLDAADVALGTDSGGSIRIPAACCGIVGFKPTYGLVSLDGCFPLAPSFDHAGPMGRDVATCERAFAALDPSYEPTELASLEAVTVGVAWTEDAAPLIRERALEAASRFPRRRGLDLATPSGTSALFMHEVADVHRELFAENADLYGEDVRIKIERCLAVRDAEASAAARRREEYREEVEEAMEGLDLLLTPTLPTVAPRIGEGGTGDLGVRESLISRTYPFNLLGWPALALPCGTAESGMPASVQLVGRPGADALVLAAGRLLERALS